MGSMFTMNHYLKIIYFVMKCIFIFMMNMFMSFKFAAKMLFHHIAMFINPPTFWAYFDLIILYVSHAVDSSTEYRFCSRMRHTTHCFGDMLSSCPFISGFIKTIITLTRVIEGVAIITPFPCNGFAADTTRFLDKWFHRLHYIPSEYKAQAIYGGVI